MRQPLRSKRSRGTAADRAAARARAACRPVVQADRRRNSRAERDQRVLGGGMQQRRRGTAGRPAAPPPSPASSRRMSERAPPSIVLEVLASDRRCAASAAAAGSTGCRAARTGCRIRTPWSGLPRKGPGEDVGVHQVPAARGAGPCVPGLAPGSPPGPSRSAPARPPGRRRATRRAYPSPSASVGRVAPAGIVAGQECRRRACARSRRAGRRPVPWQVGARAGSSGLRSVPSGKAWRSPISRSIESRQ